MAEVHQALFAGAVHLHAKIIARVCRRSTRRQRGHEALRNDAGPHAAREPSAEERTRCRSNWSTACCTKKEIGDVIDTVYRHCGQKDTVLFADADHDARLPRRVQGRHFSFGKDDMVIPASKWTMVNETKDQVKPTSSSSIRTA
ncbi:MAG: hypothetical protein LKM31_14175 [Sphingobium sp.]|jgi:DNA-directed RNA polymerase subunit beta'|nr:hypothetical protein [Sphingobium sp.]